MEKIQLTDSKKKLVLYLLEKHQNKCSLYEIKKECLDVPKNISRQRVFNIIEMLTKYKVISNVDDEEGEKIITLNKDKVSVEYTRDKFIPDVVYLLSTLMGAFVISSLLFSFDFMLGATFSVVLILTLIIYKIFRTPEMKKVFVFAEKEKAKNQPLPT